LFNYSGAQISMTNLTRYIRQISVITVAVALVGIGSSLVRIGQAQEQRRPTSGPARPTEGRPASLERNMEAMERAFKKLQAQISDPAQNTSSLELITQMQQQTLASKSQTPKLVSQLPEDQRAKQLVEYRMMMVSLLQQELELENHLLNHENDKAAESLKAIDQLQKDGHKDFRKDKRKGD
jgi:cytochrome b562